jgi:hypothetical protein
VWDIPVVSLPIPAWLPDLTEAVAGQRFNENKLLEPLPVMAFFDAKKIVTKDSGANTCGHWAKWLLADRTVRTISPLSNVTVPEYVQRRIEENSLASLVEAVRIDPTNGMALAKLAQKTAEQETKDNPRRSGEADFLSRWAVERSPDDPEVKRIRAELSGHKVKNQP